MREFWFESGSVRLCAVEDGKGRPIVMLHGGLANHWTSLGLVGSLSPRFRVVTPDLRGSGKSHDGSPLTWDRLADDVVALIISVWIAPSSVVCRVAPVPPFVSDFATPARSRVSSS
jgi:pimeloyl-ACP methyl ester carboxylesterase